MHQFRIQYYNCISDLKMINYSSHYNISFQVLKNGVVLCKLMNKISPGAVPKFKEKGMPFILMENIQSFQVRSFENILTNINSDHYIYRLIRLFLLD